MGLYRRRHCQCGQHGVRPWPQACTERAADERDVHTDGRRIDTEHAGQIVPHPVGPLGGVMNGQRVAVPDRHRGEQTDRTVRILRRRVGVAQLYVGSRDCSRLATNMDWQVAAVRGVLLSAGVDLTVVPLTPVLCFIDGEWPILLPPESYRGVRLEGKRSIKKLVGGRQVLDRDQIEGISRSLAVAFPAK